MRPWKSILGAFNTVLIIPLNNERPVVILKHSYKKLSKPSRKITLFDDHRIFWKDSIYLRLPKEAIKQYGPDILSFLYENAKVRRFDFENPKWFLRGAYEILELPMQLFNTAGIKINSVLLGEAKRYLGWLGLAPDGRGKKANQQKTNAALDVIFKLLKNTKKLNLKRLPTGDINDKYQIGYQYTDQDDEPFCERLIKEIVYDFIASIKEQLSQDSEFIKKASFESLRKVYWEFKKANSYRKTPPPLKSIIK